jgi:hypothetical protein
MNEHFHRCSFLGCDNLVAKGRKAMFCYAVHIFLGGMNSVEDWREYFKRSARDQLQKTVKFYTPTGEDPEGFVDLVDGMATEICADWRIFYIGDPNQRDEHYSACYHAKGSARRDPKKTIIIFETSDLAQEDNVFNLRAYYDWLERFPEAHICASVTDAISRLEEPISK